MSPTSGDWHVDQGMLKKLKEDYKKARGKGNKYGQSKSSSIMLLLYVQIIVCLMLT